MQNNQKQRATIPFGNGLPIWHWENDEKYRYFCAFPALSLSTSSLFSLAFNLSHPTCNRIANKLSAES